MDSRFDLKGRLRLYFPVFFELLGSRDLDWKRVTKRFEIKMDEYTTKYQRKGEPILVEVSFFGLFVASTQGKKPAISLLDFLRKLFEELTDRLDDQEKNLINSTLYGILTNIDLKYLNFIGELCVLNHVLRNTEYKLKSIEYPHNPSVKNGPKIDFKFINPTNERELLIEVVNIHLKETSTWSDEMIDKLLYQKIQGKLNRKGISKNPNFQLVPVLWGSYEDIRSIRDFYQRENITFPHTTIPVCFVGFRDSSDNVVHKFGAIDGIFE